MALTRFKLGRQPARIPVGLRSVENYMEGGTLPAAPPTFDLNANITDWGTLGNDRLGDCYWAGSAHWLMVQASACFEPIPTFTDDQVGTAYLHWTHGQDVGTVVADALAAWVSVGMFGQRAEAVGRVNYHEPTLLWDATYLFDGCGIGVALPSVAQEQFAADEPWDLTGTDADNDIEGGHFVLLSGRNRVVSWGKEFVVTDRWLERYCEEAWVAVGPGLVARRGDGHGLDIPHLKADFKLVAR